MKTKTLHYFLLVVVAAALGAALMEWIQPPSTTLSEKQKRRIVGRLHTEILVGQLLYDLPITFPPPVRFEMVDPVNAAETTCSPKRLVAGEPDWKMHVNERLAAAHWEAFMDETIPHEAGHLLLCASGDPRWSEHGDRWKSIVRELGSTPEEFHHYDN